MSWMTCCVERHSVACLGGCTAGGGPNLHEHEFSGLQRIPWLCLAPQNTVHSKHSTSLGQGQQINWKLATNQLGYVCKNISTFDVFRKVHYRCFDPPRTISIKDKVAIPHILGMKVHNFPKSLRRLNWLIEANAAMIT
jgi:hypothetical protein